jgi:hypothetical protein
MKNPDYRPLFERSYVIVTLDVKEAKEKKDLENPGGDKAMASLGGEKSGLPFYAVIDPAGKKLADSNMLPGNKNIGYPAAPEEIEAFDRLLKATAPNMTAEERGRLIAHLKKVAPH